MIFVFFGFGILKPSIKTNNNYLNLLLFLHQHWTSLGIVLKLSLSPFITWSLSDFQNTPWNRQVIRPGRKLFRAEQAKQAKQAKAKPEKNKASSWCSLALVFPSFLLPSSCLYHSFVVEESSSFFLSPPGTPTPSSQHSNILLLERTWSRTSPPPPPLSHPFPSLAALLGRGGKNLKDHERASLPLV